MRDTAKEAQQLQDINVLLQELERKRKLDKAKTRKEKKSATSSSDDSDPEVNVLSDASARFMFKGNLPKGSIPANF